MPPKDYLEIVEVLDNLNSIVEADSLSELEVTEEYKFISRKGGEEEKRELYWIQAGPNEITLDAIRENFKSVLHYLQSVLRKVKNEELDPKRFEDELFSVMVIVGEAASKLERFDRILRERIPKLAEFKGLQKFYKNVAVRREIPKREIEEEEVTSEHGGHVLDDIEVVKKDTRYELFHMKNEVGEEFYTHKLEDNLKLACDFGEFAETPFADDPLVRIKDWEDKSLQIFAKRLVAASKKDVERFYNESKEFKENELVRLFQRAVMALLLAANPRNLIRQFSSKPCSYYFNDFLRAIRELISHRDYQRFLIYQNKEGGPPFLQYLVKGVSSLIFSLYTLAPARSEMSHVIDEIIDEKLTKKPLSEYLRISYAKMGDRLESHPSGPLFKAYDLLHEPERPPFDPWMLGNLPERQAELYLGDKEILLLRMPAPVIQDEIKKALVQDEFFTFLNVTSAHAQALFYMDMQDRTSWSEHARVKAIEGLSKEALFSDAFIYANLAKDTDFYNQIGIYRELSDSDEFLKQLFIHLSEDGTGYYFPPEARRLLFPQFMGKLIDAIYEQFFKGRKTLTLHERLNFIELIYHSLTLKLLEMIRPDFLTLTSKDGLDIAATSKVGFLAFLNYGRKNAWKEDDFARLRTLLFTPTLLSRERIINPDRFSRFVEVIKLLEEHEGFFKAFQNLYKEETLKIKISRILPLMDKD